MSQHRFDLDKFLGFKQNITLSWIVAIWLITCLVSTVAVFMTLASSGSVLLGLIVTPFAAVVIGVLSRLACEIMAIPFVIQQHLAGIESHLEKMSGGMGPTAPEATPEPVAPAPTPAPVQPVPREVPWQEVLKFKSRPQLWLAAGNILLCADGKRRSMDGMDPETAIAFAEA